MPLMYLTARNVLVVFLYRVRHQQSPPEMWYIPWFVHRAKWNIPYPPEILRSASKETNC